MRIENWTTAGVEIPNQFWNYQKNGRRLVRAQFLAILAKLSVMVFCQKLNDGRGGDGLSNIFFKYILGRVYVALFNWHDLS